MNTLTSIEFGNALREHTEQKSQNHYSYPSSAHNNSVDEFLKRKMICNFTKAYEQ